MTQQHSPEVPKQLLEDNPYGETIRSLIHDAPHFNANQLSHFLGSTFVQEIVDSAQKGEFYSQFENQESKQMETHVYSAEDIISGQIETALQVQDVQPDNPNAWSVNIPRAHGLRAAVMTIMQDKRLAEPFRMAIYRKQADLLKLKDEAEQGIITTVPEALKAHSEELHAKAEEDLGEEAVEASDVQLEAAAASRIVAMDNVEQKEVQKDPLDYLREALPPVVRPSAAEAEKHNYDYLFTDAVAPNPSQPARGFGHYEAPKAETPEEKQRKYYDRFVTEENRQASRETLIEAVKATPQIREILRKHNLSESTIEAVDAIRENPDVRFEVAKVLVQKLDRLAADPYNDMGWRINKNDPNNLKVDSVTGARMKSRLYAVSMALKMIDGEFSSRHEGSDSIERDASGSVALGQHRHAASTTLMSYN